MRALVLSEFDLDIWYAEYLSGTRPTVLPYGVEALREDGFDLVSAPISRTAAGTKMRNVVEHRIGFPVEQAVRAAGQVARSDQTLALLEQHGMAAALAKRWHLPPYARRPLVIWSCWLADSFTRLEPSARRSLARTLASVELITYLSRSETEIFTSLGFSREQLFPVTYGVAAAYYTPDPDVAKDIDILAVGQDRGRDYGTLFKAVAGTALRVDIVCKPGNLTGTQVPANVTVHPPVDHVTYRQLLRRAKVVAVPTVEMAYPTGSSVALEASACGACVVVSGTRSMREYVTDGVNGLLVAVGDADGWRSALSLALSDAGLRDRLGAGARESVSTRFNTRVMWHELANVLVERGLVSQE